MNHGRSAENPGLTLQYKPLVSFTELKLWLKQKSRSFDSGSTNLKLWDKPAACAVQPMTGLVWAQLWLADLFLTLRAAWLQGTSGSCDQRPSRDDGSGERVEWRTVRGSRAVDRHCNVLRGARTQTGEFTGEAGTGWEREGQKGKPEVTEACLVAAQLSWGL